MTTDKSGCGAAICARLVRARMSTDLPPWLLWLDTETTSLDPVTTHVLEVYWQLTDWELRPIAEGHGLNPDPAGGADVEGEPAAPYRWRDLADENVIAMHEASGLAAELDHDDARRPGHGVADTLHRLSMLLFGLGHDVPLAGSGVTAFDRLILAHQYRHVAKHLTYWSIDVGPVRRMAQGLGYQHLLLPADPGGIAHRAEADVHRAQAEYHAWRTVFERASYLVVAAP